MSLNAILVILGFTIFFIVSIRFIGNRGGWTGGCNGNCKDCTDRCEAKSKDKDKH